MPSRTRLTALALLIPIALVALLVAGGPGSTASGSGISPDAAAKSLGVTYGPFLGLRCSHPVAKADCERIGIDVVFRRAATRVVAVAGDQRIALRTPGQHSGVRRHDWVGTFTEAGLAPGSYKNGVNVIRVPVELQVTFANGRHARGLFPQALLAPGWG